MGLPPFLMETESLPESKQVAADSWFGLSNMDQHWLRVLVELLQQVKVGVG